MTQPPSILSRPALLRVAAFAILFLGLALAVHVDQSARREQPVQSGDVLAAAPLAPGDSKRYGYETGQLTGATGLLLDRFARAASQLGHGRPLAILLAAASFAAAAALLISADKAA